jgi:type I restriction enzyme S subunit
MINDKFSWELTTLGDIADEGYGLVDGPFGSSLPASLYVDDGIPVIRGSNLSIGLERFVDDGFVFVSKDTANKLKRSLCYADDIVFTKKGTLGQTGIIPHSHIFTEFLISSNQMKLTVDKKKADPLFVYYYVSSPMSIQKLLRDAEATGVPKTNLAYLRSFPILLPPLPVQREIAHILGSLDDKIELNRRMNATLESMARALFRSWFVDFDPVRAKAEGRQPEGMDAETAALFPDSFEDSALGEIPAGWRVLPLDQIADFLNGLALQKFPPDGEESLPVVKIRELRQGFADSSSNRASINIRPEYIIDDGDVIFSWSGSLLVDIWCGGRGALNQHLFKVSSKTHPKWFYYHWLCHHLPSFIDIAADKATTMGHIQRHHLSKALVVIPPESIIQKTDAFLSSTFYGMVNYRLQSVSLAQARDMLLQKLMTGALI